MDLLRFDDLAEMPVRPAGHGNLWIGPSFLTHQTTDLHLETEPIAARSTRAKDCSGLLPIGEKLEK